MAGTNIQIAEIDGTKIYLQDFGQLLKAEATVRMRLLNIALQREVNELRQQLNGQVQPAEVSPNGQKTSEGILAQ